MVARFLRFLKNRRHWDYGGLIWLSAEDAPAETFRDFEARDNALSVYRLDEDGGNLEKIVCAFSLTRQHIDKVDYVIFEADIVEDNGIEVVWVRGETVDEDVNERHANLSKLTTLKLEKLVRQIFGAVRSRNITTRRMLPRELEGEIKKYLSEHSISSSALNSKMRDNLVNRGII